MRKGVPSRILGSGWLDGDPKTEAAPKLRIWNQLPLLRDHTFSVHLNAIVEIHYTFQMREISDEDSVTLCLTVVEHGSGRASRTFDTGSVMTDHSTSGGTGSTMTMRKEHRLSLYEDSVPTDGTANTSYRSQEPPFSFNPFAPLGSRRYATTDASSGFSSNNGSR